LESAPWRSISLFPAQIHRPSFIRRPKLNFGVSQGCSSRGANAFGKAARAPQQMLKRQRRYTLPLNFVLWQKSPLTQLVGENSVAAYVIFDVDIRDPEKYQEFMSRVKPALETAGAKYLARGGAHKVYEGDWEPRRLVLLEFPSVAAYESFYYGTTYQQLKSIRDACSSARMVSVEGL